MDTFDAASVKFEEKRLFILDQALLPSEECYIELSTKEDVWGAIYDLRVRGAPAIGVAAAYGLYVSIKDIDPKDFEDFSDQFREIKEYLESARPTAVNLSRALSRMEKRLLKSRDMGIDEIKGQLRDEAELIRLEDEAACAAMGEYGLSLLKPGMGILTHCNAGMLATARYGTCLSPIYLGQERGYGFKVFAGETRPLLQGARLTAWELQKAGVDVTLICDNMASAVMKKGWIDAVVVGCDRMAANGDGANKIGTSGIAILAKEYGIPFYFFVPTSTIDIDTPKGDDIEIELRGGEEIYRMWYKKDMAPKGIKTYNPAFDITEARYITAVITENGIIRPPYEGNLKRVLGEK